MSREGGEAAGSGPGPTLAASPSGASAEAPASLAGFRSRLDAFRVRIDGEIAAFLADRRKACGPEAGDLLDAVEALLLAGGKRLRPALVFFTYHGCGGREEAAVVPLAMSTELLHAYLLIHDDIMDHARVRRGGPTAHVRFAARHAERGWPGDADDYGRSMAILAGDLAYAWSVELFGRACRETEPRETEELAALQRTFGTACQEVIVGQYLEMHLPYREDPGEAELLRILRLKSGRYSVERPIELGARLAGATEESRRTLAEYGEAVGEAFQLQDDVLGVFGDEGTVGKPVGSDLAEGKRTLLVHHALRRASPERAGRLGELLGHPDPGPEEVEEAREIVRASGALEAVRGMIDERLERAARALRALDRLSFRPDAHTFFEGLIAYSRKRDR